MHDPVHDPVHELAGEQAASFHSTTPQRAHGHHGDEDALGATVDFAVNVHSPTPPEWLQSTLREAIPQLGAYPSATDLQAAQALIAAFHGIDPSWVCITNGASEAFSWLHVLQPEYATIVHPGFSEPEYALRAGGVATRHHVLQAPFQLLEDVSTQLLQANSMLVLSNPTNPTGVVHRGLQAYTAAAEEQRAWLIVDEAFMDVVPLGDACGAQGGGAQGGGVQQRGAQSSSLIPHIAAHQLRRTIVVRSLTKTWALAGLRLGYVVAHPDTLQALSRLQPHWAIGTLHTAAIAAIFRHGIHGLPAMQQQIATQRTAMIEQLRTVGITTVTDSEAPYILVQPDIKHPEHMRQQLRAQGIAIRRCDTFPGLGPNYWRLAVRAEEDVQKLVDAYRRLQ